MTNPAAAEALEQILAALRAQPLPAEDGDPPRSDVELAEAFIDDQHNRYGTRWRNDPTHGLMYWSPDAGPHWHQDRRGQKLAKRVQAWLRFNADGRSDREALYMGSRARKRNVLDMIESLPDLDPPDGTDYDTNPDLFAVPNGVVDLRTGELRPAQPGDNLMRCAAVEYDPDAKATFWEQTVREILADDAEVYDYVRRMLGYGITGHTSEQLFAIMAGGGSNGKSTITTALRDVLGPYAATLPFDMFTKSGARGGPGAEALRGARLALASETNRGEVLDAAAIKNATGSEAITVNPKYRDPYEFVPRALILLGTNYVPGVAEQDHGTWRRVKLVPFDRKFPIDRTVEGRIRAEYAGVLAWLVRAAGDWYRDGLGETPLRVSLAVDEYRADSDALDGFYPGVLVADADSRETNGDVWNAYLDWAEVNGLRPFRTSKSLVDALRERNPDFGRAKSGSYRYLTGARLTRKGR